MFLHLSVIVHSKKEHNFLGTGFVPILNRKSREVCTQLVLRESVILSCCVCASLSFHLSTGTDLVSKTCSFFEYKVRDNVKKSVDPKTLMLNEVHLPINSSLLSSIRITFLCRHLAEMVFRLKFVKHLNPVNWYGKRYPNIHV